MADKAQQQLQQQDQLKVLRIGMVKEGKVVDERMIRAGENVTVGEAARNTFPVAIKGFPAKFVLFQAEKGGTYSLNFTDKMDGKISVADGVAGLDELRASGKAKGKGGQFSLLLDHKNRGKVSAGDYTFLFQFVPAPLESARQLAGIDFRPRLVEEDDAVFFAFLGVFSTLAAVLMVYIYNTDPRDYTSIEEIPERFVELVIPPAVEPEKTAETVADEGEKAKKEEKKEESKEEEKTPKRELTAEERAAQEAARQQRERDQVMQSRLLLGILGTRGETSSGDTVVDVFSDSDAVGASLKDSLANVTGAEAATSAMGVREGTVGGRGDASIGELGRGGAGDAKVGSGPGVKVKAKSDLGTVEAEGGDADSVKKEIAKYKGQVTACYEQRLRENPTIQGRLQLAVNIAAGRVTGVKIEENSTNDAALESCVKTRVKTWRFPEDVSMELYLPFALSPS